MTTYDDRLREHLTQDSSGRGNARGPVVFVNRLLPPSMRMPVRVLATRAISPVSRRRLGDRVDRLRGDGAPVLLHLGCGTERKPVFVNLDLLGARFDVAFDLTRGIQLPDGTVDGIFHEHVLEHLPLRVGFLFLQECRRVLRPGGVLRVAVPDAGACLDSYAGKASPDWADSAPVPLMAVERLFYDHQHMAMYDSQKLESMMRVAGFRDVSTCEFGETRLPVAPDSPDRRSGTLYVEGAR